MRYSLLQIENKMMKYVIFELSVFNFLSCSPEGFYSTMKSNKNIYKEFLKYKGNKEAIKLLDTDLGNSKEIIIIGSYVYPQSFSFIYDRTNNLYYYIEENPYKKDIIYKKLRKEDFKNDNINYNDLLFILEYVLEDRNDELIDISKKAYDDKSGVYSVVKIINIDKKTYKEFSFRSFLTFEGKPVMTESEYLKAMNFE